jgi:hypothetical protein
MPIILRFIEDLLHWSILLVFWSGNAALGPARKLGIGKKERFGSPG